MKKLIVVLFVLVAGFQTLEIKAGEYGDNQACINCSTDTDCMSGTCNSGCCS